MADRMPTTPQVAVGAIVISNDRVLLVKRTKDPHRGEWAIPGGSVKLGETLQEAAEREMREETGVLIKAGDPVHIFDLIERDDRDRIRFHYVIVDLVTEFLSGVPKPSDDAADARWFDSKQLQEVMCTESTSTLLKKIRFIR